MQCNTARPRFIETKCSLRAAFIALFTLPKAYEQNKAQVDDVVSKASVELNKVYAKVKEEGGKVMNKIPSSAKKTE